MARRARVPPVTHAVAVAVAVALLLAGCAGDGEARPAGDDDPGGRSVDAPVRVVSQNILHGLACPAGTERCHLEERLALLTRQLADGGCPELVTLQEADRTAIDIWRPLLAGVCRDRYRIVWDDDPGIDREVVATTLRVTGHERRRLAGPLRTALWVRVAGPAGEVDLVSTHLASSSDDGPCTPPACPPPCRPTDTLNTCQGRQAAALLRSRTDPHAVGLLAGDLNAPPGSPTVEALHDAGLIDTAGLAGRRECRAATGIGCTSGRTDTDETDLRDPSSRQRERIDYVFLLSARRCRAVAPTGTFHPSPAPRAGPAGLLFPSDHTAVQATLRCRTTSADRAAVRRAAERREVARPSTPSTPPPTVTADAEQAIRRAFAAVFDGDAGPAEARLASLEDATALRDLFLERMTGQAALASRVRVRVDEVRPDGPDRAEVTFSLLLDGAPALDHVAGGAVRSGGRWLVSRAAFCAVALVGRSAPAPACSGEA